MAHEQTELVTDSMVAVVTRCRTDFRYVWVTSSYAAWIGRPPEDIAGRPLPDVIGLQGFETIRPYIERVLSGRKVEHTTRVNLPGRGYRWIHASYVPIYSRGVDVDGWISTVMDVTEKGQIEEERSEIQVKAQPLPPQKALRQRTPEFARGVRTLSMGEVAPSIAHEVNQPLAAVLTNAEAGLQWLSGETPNVQEAKESLALIVRDGNRASAIIRSIRALLKKERGAMACLDMKELIREAIAPARAELLKRRIALRIDCSEGLPPVWGERIQLQQVILNLTMNGGEAMACNDGSKELLVTCRRSADDSVLVAVRDSGAGVHPEYLERIFDPFFTTKDAGMGMGLSISRSIIEAHGGRIWAELNEGPGLTVQFSIPIASREPAVFNQRISNHVSGSGESDFATPKKVLRRKPPGVMNSATHQSTGSAH